MQHIWFLLMFLFLCMEIGHAGLFYFLSLAGSAGIIFMLSDIINTPEYQINLFLGLSCVGIYLIHVLIHQNFLYSGSLHYRSNNDALIGKKIHVYNSVQDHSIMLAKVLGQVWVVKNIDDTPLRQGQLVVICAVKGSHLQVKIVHNSLN